MSVAVMLQALGWVAVVWLVGVHVLIQHGRLPHAGRAYRIAGCAAALAVVAASAAEEIWPVAVLGLLWLRIEVFGHRHVPDCLPEYRHDTRDPAEMPALLVHTLGREEPGRGPSAQAHPSHLPHLHLPHVPHPHLGRRGVDLVFKVEMAVIIVIAVVFFVIWAEQQRDSFTSNTDYVVCNWIEGC